MAVQHSQETRRAAVELAGQVGAGAAADQLGVPRGTVSRWIHEAKYGGRRAASRRPSKSSTQMVEVVPVHATASRPWHEGGARLELPSGASLEFGSLPAASYLVELFTGLARAAG